MKTASENVVRVLVRMMAEAKAGRILAVGIVGVTDEGIPDVSFGGEAELVPSVNIGIDLLKLQFIQRASGNVEQQPVSQILRPAEGSA